MKRSYNTKNKVNSLQEIGKADWKKWQNEGVFPRDPLVTKLLICCISMAQCTQGHQAFLGCQCAITKTCKATSVDQDIGGQIPDLLAGRKHLTSVGFRSHSWQLLILEYKEMGRGRWAFHVWLHWAQSPMFVDSYQQTCVNMWFSAFPCASWAWAWVNATWSCSPSISHWKGKIMQKLNETKILKRPLPRCHGDLELLSRHHQGFPWEWQGRTSQQRAYHCSTREPGRGGAAGADAAPSIGHLPEDREGRC